MKLISIAYGSGEIRNGEGRPKRIDSNILIKNAEAEGDRLAVDFDFTAAYPPGNGLIRISGLATFSGKGAKGARDEWVKTRAIGGEDGELILNAIHYGASMNAVLLAKAFGMMPPVVLPTLRIAGKKKKK